MRALLAACAVALAASPALADAGDVAPYAAQTAVSASTSTSARTDAAARYKSEGPIVDNAASFIGVMSAIPSAVVGALACPVKLAGGKADPGTTYQQRYGACVSASASTGAQMAYTAGGYPFLLLKRVFWDAPLRVLRSVGSKPPKPAATGR